MAVSEVVPIGQDAAEGGIDLRTARRDEGGILPSGQDEAGRTQRVLEFDDGNCRGACDPAVARLGRRPDKSASSEAAAQPEAEGEVFITCTTRAKVSVAEGAASGEATAERSPKGGAVG